MGRKARGAAAGQVEASPVDDGVSQPPQRHNVQQHEEELETVPMLDGVVRLAWREQQGQRHAHLLHAWRSVPHWRAQVGPSSSSDARGARSKGSAAYLSGGGGDAAADPGPRGLRQESAVKLSKKGRKKYKSGDWL